MSENILELPDVRDGPGSILRQAREARGLDATAVAAMLHLSESKLEALETDNYDSLPEPVFIRGYLRNYARLLEEPEAPVLDAFARRNPTPDINEQKPLDSHVAEEVGSNHGVVKLVTVGVAVVLVALPLIWWWDNLELAAQKIVGTVTTESEPEAPATESAGAGTDLATFIPPPPPGSAETDRANDIPLPEVKPSEPEVTAPEITPAAEPAPIKVEEATAGTETLTIPVPAPVMPEVEKSVSAIKEIVEEVAPAVPEKPAVVPVEKPAIKAVIRTLKPKPKPNPKPAPQAVPASGTLFEFVETSWVKVRDASNQVILIGEYKKGTKKLLSGSTPYKVVLGNSSAVRVKVDGKSANLERYSSGGVARFTIKDGKVESP
jgi:cytoskeleton protein RodZ